MIAFSGLLLAPAKEAGIKTPSDDEIDKVDNGVESLEIFKEKYPHWFVYCILQLGSPMPNPDSHWKNAKIVSSFGDDEIKKVTMEMLFDKGWE